MDIRYKGKPARQGIVRDVTWEKEHEEQLMNVITNTSHLINTPLTVVLGYVSMVTMGLKEMTPELTSKLEEKLKEIKILVSDELAKNLACLKRVTHDGWTPVEK